MTLTEIGIVLLVGLITGVASGTFGIGGGIIIIPALIFVLGFSSHMARGTSLAMMLPPIMLISVWNYHKEGYVDFKVAGLLITTFLIGSYFGSKYSTAIPDAYMKKAFGIFLFLISIKMIFSK